jgi:hypothetical protein
LQKPWKAAELQIFANRQAKNHLFSMSHFLGFPNFHKDFFGRFGEYQGLASEKAGNRVFAASPCPENRLRRPTLSVFDEPDPDSYTTDPAFQKENVA